MTDDQPAEEALAELYARNEQLELLNRGLRLLDGPETEEDLPWANPSPSPLKGKGRKPIHNAIHQQAQAMSEADKMGIAPATGEPEAVITWPAGTHTGLKITSANKPVAAGMYGIWVTVPYTGCEGWSVNHYKVGGNMAWKRSPEAAAVRTAIGTMLGTALMETGWKPQAPLHVIISGTFRDRRHCVDLHNTIKVICDCVRDATGVDDQAFKVTTELPWFDRSAEPEIRIEIRQL